MMASTTRENIEFENVIFDIPTSNNNVSFSRNQAHQSGNNIDLNNHSINNATGPAPSAGNTASIPPTDRCENIRTKAFSNMSELLRRHGLIDVCLCFHDWKHFNHFKIFLKLITGFVGLCLIVYYSIVIHDANRSSSLKCQMCQEPTEYPTFLGNLFGNRCENGSLGQTNYECGGELSDACFRMTVVHSPGWKELLKEMMDHNGNDFDHFLEQMKVDPYMVDGTFRGCIRGFGYLTSDTNCHFFNSSDVGHNLGFPGDGQVLQTWITTKICTCMSDNCN